MTTREKEVADLVAQGLTDAAIAKHFNCSSRTIQFHLGNIYRTLECDRQSKPDCCQRVMLTRAVLGGKL